MAQPKDDVFITSLIFDYLLVQEKRTLAHDFRKMTNAVTLPKGSTAIADIISHCRKTSGNELFIKRDDRKKFSSDSNSESETEIPAIDKRTISTAQLNDHANAKVSINKQGDIRFV